jgi:hypothetical protein
MLLALLRHPRKTALRPGHSPHGGERNTHAHPIADTEADAANWLRAQPHHKVHIVPVDTPQPRTFTYLQDPDHGWLIVTGDDLATAGMSCADFSRSSYALEHLVALEEHCDMPRFLKRLDERGIAYRLHEQHFKGDAYVRYWACIRNAPSAAAEPTDLSLKA